MGYMKTLAMIEHNQELVCPFCEVVMEIDKKTLHFVCPRCSLETIVNKKVIDMM